MNNQVKGYLLAIVAAVTYGMNPLFTLPLYKEGVTADSLLFYRYAFAVVIIGVSMKWRKKSFAISKKEIIPVVIAGILIAVSSLFLFLAYKKMDAGIASTILFVYPVMVAVIMAVFFREKVTVVTVSSILLALTGIALLYKGGDGSTLNFVGVVLVIFSALAYAIYIISVKHSSLGKMDGELLIFYAFIAAVGVYFVRLKFGFELQILPSWKAFGNIISLSVITTTVSFLCMTLAVRYVGATPTSILGAFEPLTAVFLGVTVFGEQLTFRIVVGIILIILGVMLIIVGQPLLEKISRLYRRSRYAIYQCNTDKKQ